MPKREKQSTEIRWSFHILLFTLPEWFVLMYSWKMEGFRNAPSSLAKLHPQQWQHKLRVFCCIYMTICGGGGGWGGGFCLFSGFQKDLKLQKKKDLTSTTNTSKDVMKKRGWKGRNPSLIGSGEAGRRESRGTEERSGTDCFSNTKKMRSKHLSRTSVTPPPGASELRGKLQRRDQTA